MEQGSQRRSMAVIKTRASGHADYVRGSTIGASGDHLGGPGSRELAAFMM